MIKKCKILRTTSHQWRRVPQYVNRRLAHRERHHRLSYAPKTNRNQIEIKSKSSRK